MGYKIITECRACGGSKLRKFVDLGSQPLANSYHDANEVLPLGRRPLISRRPPCEPTGSMPTPPVITGKVTGRPSPMNHR